MEEIEAFRLAEKLIIRAADMRPGERSSISALVRECYPGQSFDDFDDQSIIAEAFLDLARDEGSLLIDVPEYMNEPDLSAYNQTFILRKRIGRDAASVEDLLKKLEWVYFYLNTSYQGRFETLIRKDDQGDWAKQSEYAKLLDSAVRPKELLSTNEWKTLQRVLEDAHVLDWDPDYWEPMLDGAHWEIQLRFTDGTYFESLGSNGYPERFDNLVSGLTEICLGAKPFE